MLIKDLIKRADALQESWVRVDEVRWIPTGLELCIGLYKGRRGKKTDAWRVKCLGVREFLIADLDGGGIALYSPTHPAASQYTARRADLRWSGCDDNTAAMLGAIYQAHISAVDDWITVDRYVNAGSISGHKYVCEGPAFLMRACAKALRALGAKVHLALRKDNRKAKLARPRVLHFGDSRVVADKFVVEPGAIEPTR